MSLISCFHQLENSGRVWKWWNQNCIYLGFFPNWGCLSFWVSISWETLGWLENGNKSLADWDFANIQKPALGKILLLNLNGPKCYLFRCGDLHLITATYNYSPSVTFFFFIFSKKTLSSTFPLYKVKENSPVEQLIKNNLVLNRNKVLRAKEKKTDVYCFQTGILCLLFEWSLVDSYKKKKSYCLMIVVATVEHHTSQNSALKEIEALILLVFVFSFSSPIFKEIFQI